MDSGRQGNGSSLKRPAGNGRVRVVIADDDPIILDQIGSLLEPHFDIVGHAGSGRELVAAVGRLLPSVAVTDISMPGMDGLEASCLITKKYPGVKVVIVSVHNDPDIVEAAFDSGVSAYVWKPNAYVDLIPAIEDVLAGRLYRSSGLK